MQVIVIKKVHRKRKQSFFLKNEVLKLENEMVIFEIVFGMVHGRSNKGFQKIPHIQISITHH
jgi:hypothetical protein